MNIRQFRLERQGFVTDQFIALGITHFHQAARFVAELPYGRNSNRSDYVLVLKEKRGTCSSKHALLAQICIEQGITDVELIVGIYKMSEENTPGVGKVLEYYSLTYIPEAHCYLKYKGKRYDFTHAKETGTPCDFLYEEKITPIAIKEYKNTLHNRFIADWVARNEDIQYTLDEIWKIREACIKALSENE